MNANGLLILDDLSPEGQTLYPIATLGSGRETNGDQSATDSTTEEISVRYA